MNKADKLINKWSEKTPKDARVSDVKLLLKHYFNDDWRQRGTSHIVVESGVFKPYGELSIPIRKNHVKYYYVKKLIESIQIIKDVKEASDE